MRLRVQKPLILKGRHHVCMAKNITFLSRNQQVLNSNLAITTGKRSLLKIWTNLRFTNFLKKARSTVIIVASQKLISISPTQENIPSPCLGILRVVAWSSAILFQEAGAARAIQDLLRFTLQHGWIFITLKNVKKYFHDAPTGLKVSRINQQYKLILINLN